MLAAIGIDAEHLPEIVQPGTAVGTLSSSAAQALGLSQQTLVVTGGMDQATGAIGAGNIAPGIISESTGAALAIQATITDPDSGPEPYRPGILSQRAWAVFVRAGLPHRRDGA